MKRINATQKILNAMQRMSGRKIFTCRDLAKKARVSAYTVRLYIRRDKGETVSLVMKGNSAAAATYTYKLPFCERIECFDAHVIAWAQCVKWAKIALDPDIAGLGNMSPVGNTYRYR